MATHITMAASNSQRGFDTMESSESMRSSASKRTRRSTADHIAESYKLAKKKMHSNLKNSNFKPWLVPVKYRVVNTVDNFDHTYTLSTASRIFVTFEEANSSKLSYLINIAIMLVLVVSCVQYVVVTIPSVRIRPDTCDNPACYDDIALCPGKMVCEPEAPGWFNMLEMACVIVFTVDYLTRLLTCAFTPARLCGVIPISISLFDAEPDDPEWDIVARYSDPDYEELWWVTIYRYALQPLNIIDLIAIIPFYIELFTQNGSSLSIIRILRLARVIRLVKSGKGRFTKGLRILTNTLVTSAPMNAFLLAIALILFVICGAIGYLIEGGQFRVTEDFPEGAYMRTNLLGTHLEPTPFLSVLHGMYWSIVTSTTVGYGDFYPTTWGGRIFACACTFLGIVVIALPVTVLGNHFGKEYEREYMKEDNQEGFDGAQSPSRRNSFEQEIRRNSFGNNTPPGDRSVKRTHSCEEFRTNIRLPMTINNITALNKRTTSPEKDLADATLAIRRLEEMATDLKSVIKSMKDELEMHRTALTNGRTEDNSAGIVTIPEDPGEKSDQEGELTVRDERGTDRVSL